MNLSNPLQGIELTSTQQRLWKVFVFLLRLVILSIPLYAIITFSVDLSFMQNIAAGNTYWMLNYAGYSVTQQHTAITVVGDSGDPFMFLIGEDCTAWKSMLFFFALVFAVSGARMKKRLLGLVIGIPLIWIGNLARIFMIVSIQQSFGLDAAMLFHTIFWQIGLVALVLVLWGFWFLRINDSRNNFNQEIQNKA